MSEEYDIADSKQIDFGFGVDAQAEDPWRPDLSCLSGVSTLSWVGSPVLNPDNCKAIIHQFIKLNKIYFI